MKQPPISQCVRVSGCPGVRDRSVRQRWLTVKCDLAVAEELVHRHCTTRGTLLRPVAAAVASVAADLVDICRKIINLVPGTRFDLRANEPGHERRALRAPTPFPAASDVEVAAPCYKVQCICNNSRVVESIGSGDSDQCAYTVAAALAAASKMSLTFDQSECVLREALFLEVVKLHAFFAEFMLDVLVAHGFKLGKNQCTANWTGLWHH